MTTFVAYNQDDLDTEINSDSIWPVRIYTLVIRTGFRLLPKMGKSLVQLIKNSCPIQRPSVTYKPGQNVWNILCFR